MIYVGHDGDLSMMMPMSIMIDIKRCSGGGDDVSTAKCLMSLSMGCLGLGLG